MLQVTNINGILIYYMRIRYEKQSSCDHEGMNCEHELHTM